MFYGSSMKIRVAKKPPDAYQHGDLREALVDAGLKLLAEGGVKALSLRAAAQLAGVSHAAPYRHYKDKDALVASIAERGFRQLTAAMREELGPDGHTLQTPEKLRRLGVGYVNFALRHPANLQVMFGGILKRPDVPEPLQTAASESYAMLHDSVVAGIASGELRRADSEQVALACWSMVHGLAGLIMNGALPPMAPEALRETCMQLLRHLGAGIDGDG